LVTSLLNFKNYLEETVSSERNERGRKNKKKGKTHEYRGKKAKGVGKK
jgi:hypothetical protein